MGLGPGSGVSEEARAQRRGREVSLETGHWEAEQQGLEEMGVPGDRVWLQSGKWPPEGDSGLAQQPPGPGSRLAPRRWALGPRTWLSLKPHSHRPGPAQALVPTSSSKAPSPTTLAPGSCPEAPDLPLYPCTLVLWWDPQSCPPAPSWAPLGAGASRGCSPHPWAPL